MTTKNPFKWFRKLKVLNKILIILSIVLSLYIAMCIYTSFTIYNVVDKALKNTPYSNDISKNINKQNYDFINPIQPELEENSTVAKEISHTIPFVLPFITNAHYSYTYIVTNVDTGEDIYGSVDANVDLKLDYNFLNISVADVEFSP